MAPVIALARRSDAANTAASATSRSTGGRPSAVPRSMYVARDSRKRMVEVRKLSLGCSRADRGDRGIVNCICRQSMAQVRHRYINVDGFDLFYREAGSRDRPSLLLLHGFPSSSIQFRYLFPMLSERWHLIAPDLPGFGLSAVPARASYVYSFGNLATTIEHFLRLLRLTPHALYLHDYGAQTGFRLLSQGGVRPAALIIQNSEAYYADGRTGAWTTGEAYWRDASRANRDRMRASVLDEEGIRREFLEHLPSEIAELIDPAIIWLSWDHIRRPEVVEAMLDLHLDYRSNVEHYPVIQSYFREHQPPMLVIWGREDQYYTPDAAYAYRRDLPSAEIQLLDGGHWVLESHPRQVADLTERFLASRLPIAAEADFISTPHPAIE